MAMINKCTKFIFLITCVIATRDPNRKIPFSDGNAIPPFGLGTSQDIDPEGKNVVAAVEIAIDTGYRMIDTAEFYQNEHLVGKAIENKISSGVIKREDIFVTTKLGNDKHVRNLVVPGLQNSLKKLNLSYVDLFLVHWPFEQFTNGSFGETDYLEAWKGMEDCVELGLTKSIGVSNFNESQIDRVLNNSKIRPVANQIEVNPNLVQDKLVKFCKEKNIVVIAYSPLGSIPESKNTPGSPEPHINNPLLKSIADKYKKNTVQVVLRYLMDRGLVPIPRSTNLMHIKKNFDVFDFELSSKDIDIISNFDVKYRTYNSSSWSGHKYYPFAQ